MIPPTGKSHYESAMRYFRERQLVEAERELREALGLEPAFQEAWEALAVVFFELKRYDEGIEAAKRLIQLDPENILAHTQLSRLYVAKGMILEAEHEQAESRRLSWKRELKAERQREGKEALSVEEFDEIRKSELEKRVERFKQVIALDPKDVLGYFSLGNAYLDLRLFDEACQSFEEAVRVDPQHSSSYVGLGQCLEALGRKEEAAATYERGILIACARGDIMPERKMEARLRVLKKEG